MAEIQEVYEYENSIEYEITVDDFKVVIDKKVKGWKGTNMEMYLRPETLFGTKFEGYLNEIETNKVPKWEPKGKRKYDFDALEQEALNQ